MLDGEIGFTVTWHGRSCRCCSSRRDRLGAAADSAGRRGRRTPGPCSVPAGSWRPAPSAARPRSVGDARLRDERPPRGRREDERDRSAARARDAAGERRHDARVGADDDVAALPLSAERRRQLVDRERPAAGRALTAGVAVEAGGQLVVDPGMSASGSCAVATPLAVRSIAVAVEPADGERDRLVRDRAVRRSSASR